MAQNQPMMMAQNQPMMMAQNQPMMMDPNQTMMMDPNKIQYVVINGYSGNKQGLAPIPWKNSLFGCLADFPSCYTSFFCPCIQYGQNNENLLQNSFGTPCCSCCFLAMLCGSHWCVTSPFRKQLKSKFNLFGASNDDCCIAFCCVCCTLSQEAREIACRKDKL